MSAKEIIRTRVARKVPSLKTYKQFPLFAKIIRISANSIQVSKARTNSKFWIDTTRFQAVHQDSLSKDFKVGDKVQLTVTFNSYLNKFNEHTLKIHLVDIEKAEAVETYPFEFKEQEFTFDALLMECTKTDLPNVYILHMVRLDDSEKEMEAYNIRYYNTESQPKPGTYEVVFSLKLTPNILNAKGEAFTHEEQYEVEVEGKTETRTNKVFVPCLEVREIYEQPR